MHIPGVPKSVLEDLQGVNRRTHPERQQQWDREMGPDPTPPPVTSLGPVVNEAAHNHASVDRGAALGDGPPPEAPRSAPQQEVNGRLVNRDGSVHGGAFAEGQALPIGVVDVRTGRATFTTDGNEDVPVTGRNAFAYGPAPGDVVRG